MIRVKSETHLKSQVLLDQPNRVQDLQDRDPGRSFKYMNLFVVEFPSRVQLVTIQWTAACQASLSFTISQHLLKFMSIELVMPSNHFIPCRSLLLLPSIFPSIRVFSSKLLFTSGGQTIGASASASVLPKSIQGLPRWC